MVTAERVWEALAEIPDPEIPVISLVDLGVVKEVAVEGGRVRIDFTPTFLGCPALDAMRDAMAAKVAELGVDADVRVVLDDSWSTDRITPALAKEIAAYASGAGPSKSMIRSRKDVATLQSAKLLVHPYTFRGATTAVQRRPLDDALRLAMIDEMIMFLEFGIDGGLTDYPSVWREAVSRLHR